MGVTFPHETVTFEPECSLTLRGPWQRVVMHFLAAVSNALGSLVLPLNRPLRSCLRDRHLSRG